MTAPARYTVLSMHKLNDIVIYQDERLSTPPSPSAVTLNDGEMLLAFRRGPGPAAAPPGATPGAPNEVTHCDPNSFNWSSSAPGTTGTPGLPSPS